MNPNLKKDIQAMLKGLKSIAAELPKAIEKGYENHPDKDAYLKALKDSNIIEKSREHLQKITEMHEHLSKRTK